MDIRVERSTFVPRARFPLQLLMPDNNVLYIIDSIHHKSSTLMKKKRIITEHDMSNPRMRDGKLGFL
jgi:hypothetical protein